MQCILCIALVYIVTDHRHLCNESKLLSVCYAYNKQKPKMQKRFPLASRICCAIKFVSIKIWNYC